MTWYRILFNGISESVLVSHGMSLPETVFTARRRWGCLPLRITKGVHLRPTPEAEL